MDPVIRFYQIKVNFLKCKNGIMVTCEKNLCHKYMFSIYR